MAQLHKSYGYYNLEDEVHKLKNLDIPKKVHDSILDCIGGTPLVRLNNIPKAEGIQCEMYAKCEFLNPGGSVKDRIGYRMVLNAHESGRISQEKKSVLIVPTSGNTGIGVALAAALFGYRCIIVLPEKMSDEKVNTLIVLGSEIIRTPTEAAFDDPSGNIETAKRLSKEIPHAVLIDQYTDVCNPLAHYDGTGEEILWALDNAVDMFVAGCGTGGTSSGTAIKIKERSPQCEVVGVDPYGSILAQPESINKTDVTMYAVEGIGYDFVPNVLDRAVIDTWQKVGDEDAFCMARRLQREEGLLCGGSAGSAMVGALKAARKLRAGQRCVVLLPDGMRNYMTKFVADQWMEARLFASVPDKPQIWWWKKKLEDVSIPKIMSFPVTTSCESALKQLNASNVPAAAIVNDVGSMVGVFSMDSVRKTVVNLKPSLSGNLAAFVNKKYEKVDLGAKEKPTLGLVSRILDISPFVVVEEPFYQETVGKTIRPVGLFTNNDLVQYLTEVTSNGA